MLHDRIYAFFGGLTETYAFVFTVVAIILACKGMLTPSFVGVIGAVQAFVTANDVHNDIRQDHEEHKSDADSVPGGPH